MKRASFIDRAAVIFRADFLTWIRYRNALLGTVVAVILQVVGYYYLSKAIGPNYKPDGIPSFAFLLIGIGISGYLQTATFAFLHSIREAQASGTFEILMSSSTPGILVLLMMGLSAFIAQVFELTLYMICGVMLSGVPLYRANVGAAVAVFVLSMAVTVAIGLLCACLQIAMQKGEALTSWLGAGAALFGGALFPVSVLPSWLQSLARINPLLYCLDGLRAALFKGAGIRELSPTLFALFVASAIVLPISLLLLQRTLRRARSSGTLGFY